MPLQPGKRAAELPIPSGQLDAMFQMSNRSRCCIVPGPAQSEQRAAAMRRSSAMHDEVFTRRADPWLFRSRRQNRSFLKDVAPRPNQGCGKYAIRMLIVSMPLHGLPCVSFGRCTCSPDASDPWAIS